MADKKKSKKVASKKAVVSNTKATSKPVQKSHSKVILNKGKKVEPTKKVVKNISKPVAAKAPIKAPVELNKKSIKKPEVKTNEKNELLKKSAKTFKEKDIVEKNPKSSKPDLKADKKLKKSKESDLPFEELENLESRKADPDEEDDFFDEKKGASFKFGEKLSRDDDAEDKVVNKILELSDYFKWQEIDSQIQSMDLFMPKDDACMERGCENIRTTGTYCRLHYISNWKLIQRKKEIFKENKLQILVEDIVSKFPPFCIQGLIDELDDERMFYKVLAECNITDREYEVEEVEAAEEVADDDLDLETRAIDTFRPGFDED